MEPPSPSNSQTATAVSSPTRTLCSHCATDHELLRRPDVNKDLSRPLHGWPHLAKLISDYPDFEAFPSYRDLNIKSLLYYQAELDQLRAKLHDQEWTDHQSGLFDGHEDLGENFETLLLSGRMKNNPRAQKQWGLIKEIRLVLKDYSTSCSSSSTDLVSALTTFFKKRRRIAPILPNHGAS